MSEPREVEAKFDFDKPDRAVLMPATAVGRFVVQERETAEQDDIYFDTKDELLAIAGSTLRVRQTLKGAKMTFKGRRESVAPDDEAHIATRLEDEVTLDPEQVARIADDSALPDLGGLSPLIRARAIVGDAVLNPVARLQNTRTTILLSDADGQTIELAVDDCLGTRLRDGRTIRFDEIELETKSADRAALIDVSSALRQIVPSLRPSHATKLGRTMR